MILQVTEQQLQPFWHKRSIAKEAKLVAAGHNPMDIKRGIDKAVEKITDELKKIC
jgi:chaperonin GroEL (HSP60 family)